MHLAKEEPHVLRWGDECTRLFVDFFLGDGLSFNARLGNQFVPVSQHHHSGVHPQCPQAYL